MVQHTQITHTQRQAAGSGPAADASRRTVASVHHHGHRTDTYHRRTYITRTAAHTSGAACAACARLKRAPPVCGRPPRSLPPGAQRRHASPRDLEDASSRGREDASTSVSRPLLTRTAASEPPAARAARPHHLQFPVPYRETNRRPTTERARRPAGGPGAAGRRIDDVASGGSTAAGKAARAAHACVCEQQPRDASSLSGRGSAVVAFARQVAGLHMGEQQPSAGGGPLLMHEDCLVDGAGAHLHCVIEGVGAVLLARRDGARTTNRAAGEPENVHATPSYDVQEKCQKSTSS